MKICKKMNLPAFNHLLPYKNRSIYYYSAPGNLGDCLIALSTYEMFDRIGIKYKHLRKSTKIENICNSVLIISGGGSFNSYYNDISNILHLFHRNFDKVIILPQSIFGNEELISSFGSNVDIICRESVSYRHVVKHSKSANVYQMHDLAFGLDPASDIFGALSFDWLTLREAAKLARHFWQLSALPRHIDGAVLNAFRIDREKTDISVPKDNFDISEALKPGTCPKLSAQIGARTMFRYLNSANEINTNRLHVSIAGALLKKKTNFYDNIYGKNRAVYDYSINKNFPTVNFLT